MSHLALLKHETQAIKNPPPTFQTVSPRIRVHNDHPGLRYGLKPYLRTVALAHAEVGCLGAL
jgi:hypothetical protein